MYGFGRIGRLLARLLIEKSGPYSDLRLRAIVVRGGKDGDLEKRASLLRRDSIHGPFNGSITIDKERNAIKANGSYIQVIYANSPSEIDYTQYGIDNALIVDNTGIWKDEAGLGQHLECKGAAKVLLTAPAKGNITASVRVFNPNLQTTFVRQAELRQQTIGYEDQSRRWRQSGAILVRAMTSAFLRNARLGLWLIESRSSQ